MDIARASQRSGEPRFSRFLEPPELACAAEAARSVGAAFAAHGGYADAERVVAGFGVDDEMSPDIWPIACLRLEWNDKYAAAGHRDILGALMALGVERAMMGDIQMGDGCAYLFVLSEIAGYLAANLLSAGRARLRIEEIEPRDARIAPPAGREFRVTLSSLRLDALVAEGYNLSRADAQALVRRGLVKLNHQECLKADHRVTQGDLVSVRGHGRLRFLLDQGETKKGRCGAVLFRYGE